MNNDNFALLFDEKVCAELLPPGKTNEFFEALFGDASEGSYDIQLVYNGFDGSNLQFSLLLHERPRALPGL